MFCIFNSKPTISNVDIVVATALDGVVYTENGRLHIKSNNRHYVYKFDGNPIGWYARNIKTLDDIYLGEGASPTIEFENINIKNDDIWRSVLLEGV